MSFYQYLSWSTIDGLLDDTGRRDLSSLKDVKG